MCARAMNNIPAARLCHSSFMAQRLVPSYSQDCYMRVASLAQAAIRLEKRWAQQRLHKDILVPPVSLQIP